MTSDPKKPTAPSALAELRRILLRGLGVVLPLLLTIMLLLWAWNTIEASVLRPIESFVRYRIVYFVEDSPSGPTDGSTPVSLNESGARSFTAENGIQYIEDPTGRRFLPDHVVEFVNDNADYFGPMAPTPASANAYWHRWVQLKFMPRSVVVPCFLLVFVTVLYFFGRLFTFGIGRWLVRTFDLTVLRVPIVNKVYGGVKQVTDFAFIEREIDFNRVVAIQYPSKGIWSLGFVTGDSMKEIAEATGEPMLSVLMPTSPMPMTGFTVTVPKSQAIDMDITIDEAIQFVVSCGVVVPPQQLVAKTISATTQEDRDDQNITESPN